MAVRDVPSKLPMQGWAADRQSSQLDGTATSLQRSKTEFPLQARAFIIDGSDSQSRAINVVADLWTCSMAIKAEVVRRLSYSKKVNPWRHESILIMGNHTHSGPARFLHHPLYNASGFGFDPHVFDSIFAGIVHAVEPGFLSLAPGRGTVTRGKLPGLTCKRSASAFAANPAAEQANLSQRRR